ncbi:acyl-CoA transferase [Mycolicibacterium novocastrense]|uniref:CaiB/BaiF CoA-transferase family protein n=1 Tax=Mycolicibacterium novocastrense TaxID=59813 RepID=UPI00074A1132|nr:CoA transferase [Mycolicibacterium novocastrense]KUH67529.1 acyl-CoA transferase [Mycolicibacterium novocastrense]KUH71398.1 acyl-CoA transferase [Mycolicibacterium novocastrense]KUH73285.1 acyl-CoA transferase [Mycolicibacterium novocastrense]
MDDAVLAGVRVLDASVREATAVGRLLADLGADVLKVDLPARVATPQRAPLVAGVSVAALLNDANKCTVTLDPANDDDRHRFLALAESADIVIDSGNPGQSVDFGHPAIQLPDRFNHLVVLSITDFGTQGPRASWRASDPVLYALSSVLSRSGPPGASPVLPPDGIASATATAQAAWAALVAYYQRLRTGRGDFVDFSRFEAILQSLDPPFGAQGQAAAARGIQSAQRGRPKRQDSYPIFACRDGFVRICLLAPRQWRAMRSWLGEPEAFQDPKYDHIAVRAAAFEEIGTMIADLFADRGAAELVEDATARGVPVAAVLTARGIQSSSHFRRTNAWTRVAVTAETAIDVPDGAIVIDGRRAGIRHTSRPAAGEWPPRPRSAPSASATQPVARPFDGLRILDLGVIVAGGELGRLFADLGADVVKIESPAYPDGLRQARQGQVMSESFAWTHRNQSALGLDLRTDGGATLFTRLVEHADAVFANFKPGTLASLGFSYADLKRIKPGVILAESSAYGDRGPWSARLGYGPLVRASTGITHLWSDGDAEPGTRHPFGDAVTVFPDHLVARLAAVATLAALIRRDRVHRGAHVHLSQAETAISGLGVTFATEWARAAGGPVTNDLTVHAVSPCDGDDEWCVVTIGSDDEWRAVATTLGQAELATDPRFATSEERYRNRVDLRAHLAELTRKRAPQTVATLLQRVGVAAAPMQRGTDILTDPQVVARALYTDMTHPLFDTALPTETRPARYRHIPRAELRPAPVLGQHTRDVCRRWLGLDGPAVDHLIAEGVLFETPAPNPEVPPG